MRKEIPLGICFVVGTIILLEYFLNLPVLTSLVTEFLRWRTIIIAFTLALGAGNMIKIHMGRVVRKSRDWFYSACAVASIMAAFLLSVTVGQNHVTYRFLWDNILAPGFATSFSMTAFAITSAAYRSFRARNAMAACLMVAGIIVMISRVGMGLALWPGSAPIADWIMKVPNTASQRGIDIGAGLGIIAVSFRMLLGIERSALGIGKE